MGTAQSTRARLSVTGVVGELLITAGVVVLLFLGWYVWLNDIVAGNAQQGAAMEVQRDFQEQFERDLETDVPEETSEPRNPGEPVVAAAPPAGQSLGALIIPRFGDDWVRTIGEGIDLPTVLNNRQMGVGRYSQTQMPGEIGNFAIAAHRTTYGAPFADIASLQVGDNIFVETKDGWYQYVFRGLEYVWPNAIEVLEPVPQAPSLETDDRILTMTSCNPRFSAAERIIAYAVMEDWYPREGGAPPELSGLVDAAGR